MSTILGRRRAIQGVRPEAGRSRNLAERTAVNTVIQGSAADLIKLAMIAIHRRLGRQKLPARMLLQIHDELVFEVAAERLAGGGPARRRRDVGGLSAPRAAAGRRGGRAKLGRHGADCSPLAGIRNGLVGRRAPYDSLRLLPDCQRARISMTRKDGHDDLSRLRKKWRGCGG